VHGGRLVDFRDTIAVLLVLTKALMIVLGTIFFLSGVDDLFIDICYYSKCAYELLFIWPKPRRVTEDDLKAEIEQPIAVMIPAWDESAVIRLMLENTLRTLDYLNYVIFVGTYPNDLDTHREVDRVADRDNRVQRIVTGDPGPTNKADCLNWIYQGIRLYEKRHDVQFQIHVMQDCEDVIHPLCYRLLNHVMPASDMVQLPVLSLERRTFEFTGGHYLDEFAQWHYKDLVVREMLDRSIPAAGVGCAFSRKAFATVASGNNNQVFATNSLTEDYDFGFRLKDYGLKQSFVRYNTIRRSRSKYSDSAATHKKPKYELLSVREFFPSNFRAAVKQKSRWVIGIAFQGWEHLGWKGGLSTKYMLYRDRKSLVTNLANITGYVLVLILCGVWLALSLNPDSYHFPSILERGSVLWYLLLSNFWLLGVRLFNRFFCVFRLYGIKQALLSIPRMVWGNLINFLATARAIRLYARYLRTGKLIAWDKTAHSYPSTEELEDIGSIGGDLLPVPKAGPVVQEEVLQEP
jgi:bacteriophage N4 adsorption protein B